MSITGRERGPLRKRPIREGFQHSSTREAPVIQRQNNNIGDADANAAKRVRFNLPEPEKKPQTSTAPTPKENNSEMNVVTYAAYGYRDPAPSVDQGTAKGYIDRQQQIPRTVFTDPNDQNLVFHAPFAQAQSQHTQHMGLHQAAWEAQKHQKQPPLQQHRNLFPEAMRSQESRAQQALNISGSSPAIAIDDKPQHALSSEQVGELSGMIPNINPNMLRTTPQGSTAPRPHHGHKNRVFINELSRKLYEEMRENRYRK